MHIPDGWIDLPTSATAGAVALVTTAGAARRAAVALRERISTMPAVVAAYLLVAQLLVVPVGLGTSAHLIGTGLATLLVGPELAIVCVAVVVVVQALLLADGGVTAIGLNVINDGIVPAVATWALVVLTRRWVGSRRRVVLVSGVAAGLASFVAAAAEALEFAIGGTDAIPARVVAAAIGLAHLFLAGLEGVLTALVIGAIWRLRPDMVRAFRPAVGSAAAPLGAPAATEPVGDPT